MSAAVDFEACIRVASEVAREAGALIRAALLKPKNIDNKSALDLVTDTGKLQSFVLASHSSTREPT